MYLVCVLFVVVGWKSNCQNWTVAKLKVHYIKAYRSTIRQLMSDGFGQPTKTNTNNNTRPLIQLHNNKIQPIFPTTPPTVAQVDRAVAEDNVTKVVGSSLT